MFSIGEYVEVCKSGEFSAMGDSYGNTTENDSERYMSLFSYMDGIPAHTYALNVKHY